MYFGTRAYIAELSFYQNGGIDCFNGFDCLSGPEHVLLKRQHGRVEDDGIKTGPGCLHSLRQGVCMVCIKKNRKIEFLAQTSHQSSNLMKSYELALLLGHTNHDRDVQFLRGSEDCL